MIAACDTQDFVPFGREYIHQHPGRFQLQVQNALHADHGLPLLKSFRDISIQDNSRKEQFHFHSHQSSDGHSYDEELYLSGNTVVWSRGGQDGARSVVKTFTVDSPVIQAVWATFVVPTTECPSEGWSSLEIPGEVQHGVAVVEASAVSFFMESGGEYITSLPFQVAHCWVIKNGLLFERTVSPTEISGQKKNSPNQTTIFSMLHPLDEVAPVITKTSSSGGGTKVSYLTDNTQHIVYASVEPSLVFTYDTMVGVHSAWKVRRVRSEECAQVCGLWDMNSFCMHPGVATPLNNMNQSSSSHSRFLSNLSGQSPSVSPLRSYSRRNSSPAMLSKSQSPGVAHMMDVRRSQSPAVGTSALFRFHSPSPQTTRSPGTYFRTPPVGSNNVSLINESFSEWVEPLTPEVCFEHLWTEPAPAIRDGSLGKSSKAFLTRDMCGQQYLCYVISYRQQLRCVKFEESNDLSQLIFGTVAVIPAKDALPIESQDLLLVLDPNSCLFVYSGTTKINKLHVPTLPLGSGSLSILRSATPLNSPTRGGVFTSSRPPSAVDARFDEELCHLSPVPTELDDSASQFEDFPLHNSFIQSLRDSVGERFTVELVNGNLCRSSMPTITSSPGIDLCLKALKHMLPKDLAMQVLGKWYTVRNSPGGLGNQSEWTVFTKCVLDLMGYDTTRLALTNKHEVDMSMSPVIAVKRPKPSDQGSEDDWEYLMNSDHHQCIQDCIEPALKLSPCVPIPDETAFSRPCGINMSAILFAHIPSAFMAMHLVYEELKLNTLLAEEIEHLTHLLFQLACDLKCGTYSDYYCRDFPNLFHSVDDVSQIAEENTEKMQYPSVFSPIVPSVHMWIYNCLLGLEYPAIPYIPNVCNNMKNVVSLYAVLLNRDTPSEQAVEKCLRRVPTAGHRAPNCDLSMSRSFFQTSPTGTVPERIVLFMTELGMSKRDLEYLPVGISLPLREAIYHCCCNPPSDWPEEAYVLIGRQDLFKLLAAQHQKPQPPPGLYTKTPQPPVKGSKEEEDGMEHLDEELLKLRFSEDLRVQEVRRLLQSSKPARIALIQRPEVSDHDFIEEQERYLYAICIRTMALPVGRGMFTMCTYHPLPTEALPIPKLCLTGRAPPRNATVDLTHIDPPPNMSAWPHFHNGIAAGLRIANSSQIESTWIIYNKPKSNELTNEFAGFLMALGLNGHLLNLHTLNVHDYLSKGHEMTTVGLLLGLAAAKRGTMDLAITRGLSIHVPALLPPTTTELNVPHNVQVAAVLGVGLVFQGTAHRHTAEILLSEIGRPPGPEMENCTDRESYSLAAGLGFGLVMFGKGNESVGMSDLSMADTLCHFMIGGHKRPLIGPNKERYKSPSYQIKEGDSVNVDVTAPGATLALGMLYFNTNNTAVADWLKAPDTQFMLDHVRPDFLMLRTLSRGLVMWESVVPTSQWINSNVPQILKRFAFHVEPVPEEDEILDFETMSQAYCNIVAGACMVMGLKFAGSANEKAFNTLKDCMRLSLQILSTANYSEMAGKGTVENCMITILISLAMVMAGTGNLEVLRICRMLRSRVGAPYNLYVMYGSHMAISMSLGLLFLGGGRYTLKTQPGDIAVLLCAFFPKFPTHSNDNRYHLQAFRHLYVLAAEPRVVLPRDVDMGSACYVPIEVKFKDTKAYSSVSYQDQAPCLLPELDRIQEVKVLGPRYWPMVFHMDKNWNTLKLVLQNNGTLYVKQRAGHLSYVEDPKGYRSMLAKSLTRDHSSHCRVKPDVVKAFTSDSKIVALTEYFLKSKESQDLDILQTLSMVVYECVTHEKPDVIPLHLDLDQVVRRSEFELPSVGLWQLKLVLAYYQSPHCVTMEIGDGQHLLKLEFLLALKNQLEGVLDQWQTENMDVLVKYLQGELLKGLETSRLSPYLTWLDIPNSSDMLKVVIEGVPTLPVLCSHMPHLNIATVMRILSAWQAAR